MILNADGIEFRRAIGFLGGLSKVHPCEYEPVSLVGGDYIEVEDEDLTEAE